MLNIDWGIALEICGLVGVPTLLLLGAYLILRCRYVSPKVREIPLDEEISYRGSDLVYHKQYGVQVPTESWIGRRISEHFPPKAEVDLSSVTGRGLFHDVRVLINDEGVGVVGHLNYASTKFDLVHLLRSCQEFSYSQFQGQNLKLQLDFYFRKTVGDLKHAQLLDLEEDEYHPEYCDVIFRNGNVTKINNLVYKKRLRLDSLVLAVQRTGHDGVRDVPFSIHFERNAIRDRQECEEFWTSFSDLEAFPGRFSTIVFALST